MAKILTPEMGMNPETEETASKLFKAVQLSDGQAAFIAERTGELTVFPGSSAFGWWHGFQGPIGRIGKPFDENIYQRFTVKKIVLYIETGLLAEADKNRDQIKVFMGDYGKWTLRLVQ